MVPALKERLWSRDAALGDSIQLTLDPPAAPPLVCVGAVPQLRHHPLRLAAEAVGGRQHQTLRDQRAAAQELLHLGGGGGSDSSFCILGGF